MSSDPNGLRSALWPLGAALLGAGVALAVTGGANLVAALVLALVGAGLVFAGGAPAAPPPPPPPPPPPIPQPATTVTVAAAFGAAAVPGNSADYARADHSHGLPALPPSTDLGGDVTGSAGAARVAALQGVPLDATGATQGQVLAFDGGRWSARTLPAAPPPPPVPAPGGDLTGELDHARVSSLQGVALQAGGAAAGQVLTFDGTSWTPRNLPAPPPPPPPAPSDFVGRGDKPLRIVAMGELELRLNNGVATLGSAPGYGGLRAVTAARGATNGEYLLVVQAADGPNPAQDAYSVQLTPMRATGSGTVFGASVQGGVINDSAGAVRFTAVLSSPGTLLDGAITLRLAVMVSRFGV